MRRFLILALIFGISIPTFACSPKKRRSLETVVEETLISTTESWNGDSFQHPRGQAEMKLEKITAQPVLKHLFIYIHNLGLFLYKKEFFITKRVIENL